LQYEDPENLLEEDLSLFFASYEFKCKMQKSIYKR